MAPQQNKCVVEDKVWGKVRHIFVSPHAAVSCLEVKAGFRCSVHRHRWRDNQFTVLSGKIVVAEDWYNNKLWRKTVLSAGESHVIRSGVYHCFHVLESGQVVEVYWPDEREKQPHWVSLDDIERLDEGGVDEEAFLPVMEM